MPSFCRETVRACEQHVNMPSKEGGRSKPHLRPSPTSQEREKTIFLPLKSLQKKTQATSGKKYFLACLGTKLFSPPAPGEKVRQESRKSLSGGGGKKTLFHLGIRVTPPPSSFLAPGGGGETILKAQGPCSQERGGERNAFLRSLSPCL